MNSNKYSDNNKRNALLGFLGGVAFMIGDCLLYIYPGRYPAEDIDPVFAAMPAWRFTASAFLGILGMALMLFGFQSLYAMTREVCGKGMQRFMLIGGAGVAGVALAHFNLGSLLPLTYKAVIGAGGTAEMAADTCRAMSDWVTPIDIVLIAALYVQLIVLLYMILSGRSGLSKWFVLVGPFGAVAVGLLWSIVFRNTPLAAGWGSCESLGEGLMYLAAYAYWNMPGSGIEPGFLRQR